MIYPPGHERSLITLPGGRGAPPPRSPRPPRSPASPLCRQVRSRRHEAPVSLGQTGRCAKAVIYTDYRGAASQNTPPPPPRRAGRVDISASL